MHGVLPSAGSAATNSADQSTDQTDSESWFKVAVDALLPVDAGYALHIITEKLFHERSCYRYASGERRPDGDFVRALLRSEQGRTWLNAIMDGCDAGWWRDHCALERKAAQLEQIRSLIGEQ